MISSITKASMKTIECYPVSYSGISSLFCCRAPLAVFFAIISVYINTIYRFTNRTLSHIRKEVPKVIEPILENRYPAASVVFVLLIIGIITSNFNFDPSPVSPAHPFHFGRVSMFGKPLPDQFRDSASARLGSFGSAIRTKHFNKLAAFALTEIENPSKPRNHSGWCLAKNFSLSKWLTNERYLFWHNGLIVCASGGHPTTIGDRCAILAFLHSNSNLSVVWCGHKVNALGVVPQSVFQPKEFRG